MSTEQARELTITIDGVEVPCRAGQTILQAAEAAGIYIPRLCYHPDMVPGGHCRVCSVSINGRIAYSCGTPVARGMIIENDTAELNTLRRHLIEMLFVEGNHFCSFCEASGQCELQALGYRLGMTGPEYDYLYPRRAVDATHPDVFLDRNRCILCGRCVRASKDVDEKRVLGFERRGLQERLAVDGPQGLGATSLRSSDKAMDVCPVGSLVRKRTAYRRPYGQRRWDREPIGTEVVTGTGRPYRSG